MKLCVIYNTAPKYRERIFKLIDETYDCDWYFGYTTTDIKEMNTSILKKVTYYKSIGNRNRLYYKQGVLQLLFKKQYQYFLILAESRSLTDYLFLFLATCFFPQKKIYIWTHGWYGKESKIEAKLKLWMFRHTTGIFLYGNYAKKLLIEQGIPEKKLFVIHNSLYYDKQKALRENIHPSNIYSAHFGNNNPVLIFIGRLTLVKRLDMLIKAIAILKEKREYYNLVFVGDGEMRYELGQLTSDKQLGKSVWFYGECYDEATNAKLIYNADLCVAPGNVGLTAMHAMAFGCPVISHNDFKWQMPEFEAIKRGKTGDFFERGNIESLADAISHWFMNKKNREEVRQECFQEIDNFWNPYYQMKVLTNNLK